jgi:multidrug resistance efflux pump
VMAFIDTSATRVVVEIDQINARYVAAGQQVEIAFKFLPGRIFTGKVESILQAVATGQAQVSGQAVMPKGIETVPFVVRVALDDGEFAKTLPAGATGAAAIFTDHVKVSHLIRRVLLRQVAILDYVNPF